ncbi:MAG: hypothetical protein K2X81_02345, partial [Candidatus Obscuribacterales bacterium]|nr:hypothetical protein [Candidatus Obscuribacterales bacterium]
NLDPHAVIVKLDVSQQLPINRNPAAGTESNIKSSEQESRELATQLISRVHMVPHIAVYNPNNIQRFVGPSVVNPNAAPATLHTELTVAGKKVMEQRK